MCPQGGSDSLPTPHMWATHSEFFPKKTVWKGGGVGKTPFLLEKPEKHYLSQELKINMSGDKSCIFDKI